MLAVVALAALLQSHADMPRTPEVSVSAQCTTRDNIINANLLVNCLPGLQSMGLGTLREPEEQADGTFVHNVPFRAHTGTNLETKICGIDLIDFSLRSGTGAVLIVNEIREEAQYCLTKQFVVPAGEVMLTLRTRTRNPILVIRSSVPPAPVAALLEGSNGYVMPPPTIILMPPPPPPPVAVPPASPPPPPMF